MRHSKSKTQQDKQCYYKGIIQLDSKVKFVVTGVEKLEFSRSRQCHRRTRHCKALGDSWIIPAVESHW